MILCLLRLQILLLVLVIMPTDLLDGQQQGSLMYPNDVVGKTSKGISEMQVLQAQDSI